jgi:hypothetical protein
MSENAHLRASHQRDGERGIALVVVMLILVLATSVLAGFLMTVTSDVRLRGVDRSRAQAWYAAHAGLEKLTSDLGDLFAGDPSPSEDQLAELEEEPPAIPDMQFVSEDGLGYKIGFTADADGSPTAIPHPIESGPFQGFTGLLTKYTLTSTARTPNGSEVRLERTLNTVGIPVFQFGIFSETDLSYFPGPAFSFGGRVHTNGNLFLASGTGPLSLTDKVTAVNQVVRWELSNGWDTDNGYMGQVLVRRTTGAFPGAARNLERTEGSVEQGLGSDVNEAWEGLSLTTYNANIRNGDTGARRLDLELVNVGATPIDLIKRPVVGEPTARTRARLYAQAQIRILLSDTAVDITSLPGVSAGDPVELTNAGIAAAGYVVDDTRAPIGESTGAGSYRSDDNTPLLGGFLKVEYRNEDDDWVDVTGEWLGLGFTRRNLDIAACDVEPSPDAILRFQRVRENPAVGAPCALDSTNDADYWPLVLFDAREEWPRDNHGTDDRGMHLGGIMHYVDLDVNNLRRWLAGDIGVSGDSVVNEDGYALYFSDRRGNRSAGGNDEETGELGFEDFVNRNDPWGFADNALENGEDMNGNENLDTYGNVPEPPPGAQWPLDGNATLQMDVTSSAGNVEAFNILRRNRAIFFRRGLKLTNGAGGNLPADGFTVVSENPVYVQGNYNSTGAANFAGDHVPAAIMADAVTLLSNRWDTIQTVNVPTVGNRTGHGDSRSMLVPHFRDRRDATTTWYRFAVIAGKGRSFDHIAGYYQDYGTDGGVHNFLRY